MKFRIHTNSNSKFDLVTVLQPWTEQHHQLVQQIDNWIAEQTDDPTGHPSFCVISGWMVAKHLTPLFVLKFCSEIGE